MGGIRSDRYRRTVPRVEAAVRGAAAGAVPSARFACGLPCSSPRFWLVHVWWSLRGFRGDQSFLPALLLLTGIGLILMVSLRDPVRDNLLFVDFAQGAVGGCVLLAVLSALDYERLFGKLSFVPLLASFGLSVLLIAVRPRPRHERRQGEPVRLPAGGDHPAAAGASSWPDTSRTRWDVLRHARETPARAGAADAALRYSAGGIHAARCWSRWRSRWSSSSCRRTWGRRWCSPACSWRSMRIARGSAVVPLVGLALLVAGFAVGYLLGVPHTVGERVSMWLSPWDNLVHGGDQLAHSLWAFATGGVAGTGIGLGDPQLVPAAHTDLILSALGEEWGFLGVAAVFALYALHRLPRAPHRPARAHRLRILPGGGTGGRHRPADPADRRRRAGRAAALRRGHAVPQLRPHRDAGELRDDRDPAFHLGAARRDTERSRCRSACR